MVIIIGKVKPIRFYKKLGIESFEVCWDAFNGMTFAYYKRGDKIKNIGCISPTFEGTVEKIRRRFGDNPNFIYEQANVDSQIWCNW